MDITYLRSLEFETFIESELRTNFSIKKETIGRQNLRFFQITLNGLQDVLDSKSSSESTSINGTTISNSSYTDGYSISVSEGTEYLSFTAGLNEDGD